VETFFDPKNCTPGAMDLRRDRLSVFFAVSGLESIRAQPQAMLTDLNGHTARTP
jgi:hypothetical protein